SLSRGPGTAVRLDYDADGRLATLEHAGGKRVQVRWDGGGARIVALECSDGRRATYAYDDALELVATGGEQPRRYELDDAGLIRSIVDADGVVEVVNDYDRDGRVIAQRSPFGRCVRLAYLPGRVAVAIDDDVDVDGPVNTYVHDDAGRLLQVVDGAE